MSRKQIALVVALVLLAVLGIALQVRDSTLESREAWMLSLEVGALGLVMLVSALAWTIYRSVRADVRLEEVQQALQAPSRAQPFPMPGANPLAPPTARQAEADSAQSVADSLRPPAWLES
ncbi:MAG: hypothetical protein ACN6O3_21545, partial [Comamonas sp.]